VYSPHTELDPRFCSWAAAVEVVNCQGQLIPVAQKPRIRISPRRNQCDNGKDLGKVYQWVGGRVHRSASAEGTADLGPSLSVPTNVPIGSDIFRWKLCSGTDTVTASKESGRDENRPQWESFPLVGSTLSIYVKYYNQPPS
jgi:hypothetical protein